VCAPHLLGTRACIPTRNPRILAAAVPDGRFVSRVCDVRDEEAVSAVVREVADAPEPLEVALHVAGVIQVGHADTVTLGHVHDAVDTMLWGPVHLALAVLPIMRDAGHGRSGVVSSVGGLVAVPRLVPYSVAKSGAVGLAEGLYAELAGTGVTVTAVTPGLMRTGRHTHPTVELTPLTIVGRRVHGLAPATTIRAMGLVSRLLPGPGGSAPDAMSAAAPAVEGRTARSRLSSRVVDGLSVLGDRAARRTNEVG
jgi:NAD(P)-dependent dehydrogenase (short-subunit alcohol dehydrogenase family)